jgi:hypothetical protein
MSHRSTIAFLFALAVTIPSGTAATREQRNNAASQNLFSPGSCPQPVLEVSGTTIPLTFQAATEKAAEICKENIARASDALQEVVRTTGTLRLAVTLKHPSPENVWAAAESYRAALENFYGSVSPIYNANNAATEEFFRSCANCFGLVEVNEDPGGGRVIVTQSGVHAYGRWELSVFALEKGFNIRKTRLLRRARRIVRKAGLTDSIPTPFGDEQRANVKREARNLARLNVITTMLFPARIPAKLQRRA